jgi:EAL and modified HD-GYP domain-containing signal transduction protein
MELVADASAYEPIFVARQPIFDAQQRVWGYELLFRHSGEAATARVEDADQATAAVIADGFALASQGMEADRKVLINFPAGLILKNAALALPTGGCVVEILETVRPEPNILKALAGLKQAGYTLALDDYVGDPGFEPLLKLADIVKVEVLGMPPPTLIKLGQRLHKTGKTLLAEKVEDAQVFKICKGLGFSLFQGYFFSKPQVMSGRKVSAGAMAKVQLLAKLAAPDFEPAELSRIISADISLSYRLLRFINSAAFSLPNTVRSLTQAVTLLGNQAIKQWLMVVLMADLTPSRAAEELAFTSVQRARFLERLGAICLDECTESPDAMFMLGLFTRLDSLLGMPMGEIVEQLPLEERFTAALAGERNAVHRWIDLLDAVEAGQWEDMDALLDSFGLDAEEVAQEHAAATVWAHRILGHTVSEDEAARADEDAEDSEDSQDAGAAS